MEDYVTVRERADLWERVQVAAPAAVLDVLGPALQTRICQNVIDPLRNRFVRKLVRGCGTSRLAAQFEAARAVLRDERAFVQKLPSLKTGRGFDQEVWPWYAEVRALEYLRSEGVDSADAIVEDGRGRAPDFNVRRGSQLGLAEVKRISPNDNYAALEEELEMKRIRHPDVFAGYAFELTPPDDTFVRASRYPSEMAQWIEKVESSLPCREMVVEHTWPVGASRVTARVRIERVEGELIFGTGTGFVMTDDAKREWLTPFRTRLDDRAHSALAQMIDYERRQGVTYSRKEVNICFDEPASSLGWLAGRERQAIVRNIEKDLRSTDASAALAVLY